MSPPRKQRTRRTDHRRNRRGGGSQRSDAAAAGLRPHDWSLSSDSSRRHRSLLAPAQRLPPHVMLQSGATPWSPTSRPSIRSWRNSLAAPRFYAVVLGLFALLRPRHAIYRRIARPASTRSSRSASSSSRGDNKAAGGASGMVGSGGAPSRRRDRAPVNTCCRRSGGDVFPKAGKINVGRRCRPEARVFPRRLAGAPALPIRTDTPAPPEQM
jgi:hypothetical protein